MLSRKHILSIYQKVNGLSARDHSAIFGSQVSHGLMRICMTTRWYPKTVRRMGYSEDSSRRRHYIMQIMIYINTFPKNMHIIVLSPVHESC